MCPSPLDPSLSPDASPPFPPPRLALPAAASEGPAPELVEGPSERPAAELLEGGELAGAADPSHRLAKAKMHTQTGFTSV